MSTNFTRFLVFALLVDTAHAAEPTDSDARGEATFAASSNPTADVGASTESREEDGQDRLDSMRAQNAISGSTGMFRTIGADSGRPGTFRFSVLGSFYAGSEVLCPDCELPDGTVQANRDDLRQVGTRVQLSATPLEFLEAYGALRFQTTENDQGEPKAMHIVGDTNLGVKGFLPFEEDRIYSFGGALDVLLLNRPGAVGIDTANFGARGLASLDLRQLSGRKNEIPLRANLNLAYLFDNSDALAESIEQNREEATGTEQRITRIERFAHDINRADTFTVGVGVEGAFEVGRPFAEWSLDIPVARGHDCVAVARSAGDGCLDDSGFSSIPSRLTVGGRIYPWYTDWLEGLAVLAAVDIGTSGTSNFVEEVAPELPWTAHIGLAYALDTQPQIEVQTRKVERVIEVEPVEHFISGVVVDAKEGTPVPDAVVRYEGENGYGIVANGEGRFRSMGLEPGTYTLAVSAQGYRDGQCVATIPPPAERRARSAAGSPERAKTASPSAESVECELEPLPKTATITGVVRDAETTVPIQGASIEIEDPRSRTLALTTDDRGGFRFEQVPSGVSRIAVEHDGYLRSVSEFELEPRKDLTAQIMIHKKPARPNVVVTPRELKLKEQVHFLHDSSEILPDSMAILEEIAEVLRERSEISHVEIQGHTDDVGGAEYNQRLSTRRAEAVREALMRNGVDASRLTAKGYGQAMPLVPNTSDNNRAKNRRVQLMIKGQ